MQLPAILQNPNTARQRGYTFESSIAAIPGRPVCTDKADGAKLKKTIFMNYSLEKLTTVAECDALLELAVKDKESTERRRRNLSESIGTFGERTGDYSSELESVETLLETYAAAHDALPEGKNKMTIFLQIKRLEARKAQLDKIVTGYNASSLIGKQTDFNLLDSQVPALDALITAIQARRVALGGV